MFDIPPELDFTSEHFDPSKALKAKNIYLPYPKAKTYNNLADWYYQTFLKKKSILPNQESQKASKSECFVLRRNYEWYYETLGLDLPANFDINSRYQKYTKRKRDSNGKYQVDKKVIVKEMPSEMLQPIRSSKILVKRSDGSLKDCILVNTDGTTISKGVTKVRNTNIKDKTMKLKQFSPTLTSNNDPKYSEIPSSKNAMPLLNMKPLNLKSKKSDLEPTNCDNAPKRFCSESSVSSLPTVLLNLVNKSPKNDSLVLPATSLSVIKEKLGLEFKKCATLQNKQSIENSQHNSLEASVTAVNEKYNLEFMKNDCVPKHDNTTNSSKEISTRKTDIQCDNVQICTEDMHKLYMVSSDVMDSKFEKSVRHGHVLKVIGSTKSDDILEQSVKPVDIQNKNMPLKLQKGIKDNISLKSIENVSIPSVETSMVLNKKSTLMLKKCNDIRKEIDSSSISSVHLNPLSFEKTNCDVGFCMSNSNKEIKSVKDTSSAILRTPEEHYKESCLQYKGSLEERVSADNHCSVPVNPHKVEEKTIIKSVKLGIIQNEIVSKSVQSSSISLSTLIDIQNKQLYSDYNKLERSVKEARSINSVASESSVNHCNMLKEKSKFIENDNIQREMDCTDLIDDCSPVSEVVLKEQNKKSVEFNKCDETTKEIRPVFDVASNPSVIESKEAENKKSDLEFVKNNDKCKKVNQVKDMPSFMIHDNSSDLALTYDRNQKEICISESVNCSTLSYVIPDIVQNEKLCLEYDKSEQKKPISSIISEEKMLKEKTHNKNIKNKCDKKKIDSTNLFCENSISVKRLNKKSALQLKESNSSKQKSSTYAEDCRICVSPLKEQNKNSNVRSRKCNSSSKETNAQNSINSVSIPLLKDKENTKELALLELARRARKRIHIDA